MLMPEPLNYRNPKSKDPEPPAAAGPVARAVIPVEFDRLLTRTQDHGAARAVEVQLARERVAVFRSEDGSAANRCIELYVRGSQWEAAAQIAGRVFARRERLRKALGKPPTLMEMPGGDGGGIFIG
jgi:hypothetical protein